LDSATIAASGSPEFMEKISTAEKRHFDCVSQLIGKNPPQELISFIKDTFEEIKNLCNGILLLNELTPRSKDRIAGYGELLSSKIITTAFNEKLIKATWLDARKLIVTNSAFGSAIVDFDVTNKKINEAVNKQNSNLFID
jgi:aspartokinase/homoserine dehydrogenase 1